MSSELHARDVSLSRVTMRPEYGGVEAEPGRDAAVMISVRNVGKMYRLYDRPQDRLKEQLLWRFGKTYGREFWALRDACLEVRRGETVGIIGRNGSGKSTLLQIIAGTLTPTAGEVSVTGRVAALLELGSGFNPEFTGRENVFLNGAILNIAQAEMERRFDEIAAFADIGEFIEQPVKLYSSGMVLRLAFAVQAHVEADVLIVDEALSVGDAYFQHKCMRRIRQLVERGMTLLFVSHATDTVKRLCRRGLWLDSGQTRYCGDAGVAVEKYLAFMRMREPLGGTPIDHEAPTEVAPPRPATLLRRVSGEVDLTDETLFLRGSWTREPLPGLPAPARHAGDSGALAGFRCAGSEIDLLFVRGPEAGAAHLTLDGSVRVVDLFHPTERRIESVRFHLPSGEHTVLIAPAEPRGGRGTGVWWIGGRVRTPPTLTFRRDPNLGDRSSEVDRYGTAKARLTAVEFLDYFSESPLSEVTFGERVRLRLHAERLQPIGPRVEFSYIVRDRNRVDLFGTTTIDEGIRVDPNARRFVVEFAFDVRLAPASYSVLAAFVECSEDLTHRVPLDQIDIAYVFNVGADPVRRIWYIYHEPAEVTASVYEG